VEAVVMSYDTTGRYMGSSDTDSSLGWGHRRATLCVSSQVGCQMGCTFCATGARLEGGGAAPPGPLPALLLGARPQLAQGPADARPGRGPQEPLRHLGRLCAPGCCTVPAASAWLHSLESAGGVCMAAQPAASASTAPAGTASTLSDQPCAAVNGRRPALPPQAPWA
jgi:hypothetical protein